MNFKKCTSLFLAILILVSNVGLAFSVHYCEGKIAAITSVFNTEKVCEMEIKPAKETCCAKKVVEKHKNCCKDKVVNFKDKSDDTIVKTFSFQIDAPFTIAVWKPVFFQENTVQESN